MSNIFNENTTINSLTDGKYHSLFYDPIGRNFSSSVVTSILGLIDKAGGIVNKYSNKVDNNFRDTVLSYQKRFGLKETGVLDDNLLQDIIGRAQTNANDEITDDSEDDQYSSPVTNVDVYDAHYDPFFLNNSDKIYRRNHKDIIISFGDGTNHKIIKDVFMRSVSVQVDTSGNPISEVYNFIARDVKEADASEDTDKYIGEENTLSASSDIKYTYDTLFKDF